MQIIPFQFNTSSIRVIDKDGEPWFVAKDVAVLLGYKEPRKAVLRHCLGGMKRPLPTTAGIRELVIIPERDVYRLIMRSKLPEAQQFEDWVVGEVLPSIRKTGNYGLSKIDWGNTSQVAGLLAQSIERVQEQDKQIAELKPKANFHDRVAVLDESTSVEKAAKIIGTGRNRLMAFLRRNEWVTMRNVPYQAKINQGLMDVKINPWTDNYGRLHENITPLVTAKGLVKLQKMWDNEY
ncbi:phage antirepressor KilAC domain-containing protein [Endozoicomonas sp. SM1973]|uniref:Phage antirepressor KilAC domain-containing protein n=1 Tax=Spartinivicinus marinus TaxID=2994442 RepID=A0A853I9E9_9GAMM|nr:phage antirepressor [Spartinivicinus marinus]NYZ69923.1 phage antirepressor KilAC domain-containing protein [Spartinivicinus marinus]